jgi:chromosome condensin MukBEF MukE localization factor
MVIDFRQKATTFVTEYNVRQKTRHLHEITEKSGSTRIRSHDNLHKSSSAELTNIYYRIIDFLLFACIKQFQTVLFSQQSVSDEQVNQQRTKKTSIVMKYVWNN